MKQETTDLKDRYSIRYEQALNEVAKRLEEQLKSDLNNVPRIDRISARAKSVDRFLKKAAIEENSQPKYIDPIKEIQDQIGARVVVFYSDDVEQASREVESYYRGIENQTVVPDSESKFGYFGKHYIFFLPEDLLEDDVSSSQVPKFFELQIKTLFQHAWSEANHDLGYKPESKLAPGDERLIAFSAAQAWGADRVFSELFRGRKNRCSG